MNDHNNGLSSSKVNRSPIRPLPPLPVSRRISRPLPGIPQALICKNCQACITSRIVLLPLMATCMYHKLILVVFIDIYALLDSSREFRGYLGEASLFTQTYFFSASFCFHFLTFHVDTTWNCQMSVCSSWLLGLTLCNKLHAQLVRATSVGRSYAPMRSLKNGKRAITF